MPSKRHIDPQKLTTTLNADAHECAHLIGVSPSTFYKLLRRGEAPPSFVVGRRRLFPREGIAAWIAERVRRKSQRVGGDDEQDQRLAPLPEDPSGGGRIPYARR